MYHFSLRNSSLWNCLSRRPRNSIHTRTLKFVAGQVLHPNLRSWSVRCKICYFGLVTHGVQDDIKIGGSIFIEHFDGHFRPVIRRELLIGDGWVLLESIRSSNLWDGWSVVNPLAVLVIVGGTGSSIAHRVLLRSRLLLVESSIGVVLGVVHGSRGAFVAPVWVLIAVSVLEVHSGFLIFGNVLVQRDGDSLQVDRMLVGVDLLLLVRNWHWIRVLVQAHQL